MSTPYVRWLDLAEPIGDAYREFLSGFFDECNEAVERSVAALIDDAHAVGTKVGICGQAPSDYPEFAEFLVEQGIDSISLNRQRRRGGPPDRRGREPEGRRSGMTGRAPLRIGPRERTS